ncbi:MAG TPA: Gfo/Idh/MocA family oxidoreductase [Acidimicrobiia bacterium]|nr:Gfo/Idh/MocA family oxidoreductase [Acidimicrobiia bacterium]
MAAPAPIDVVMVGAGQRGHHVYGRWLLENPRRARAVAVVEPDPIRRGIFGDAHRIPSRHRFPSIDAWMAKGRVAEACIVATPDRAHEQPAAAALVAGYEVLVEKPMGHDLPAVLALVESAGKSAGSLHVAHVLRYAPLFRALHETVASGVLGDIVSVTHSENLWAFHMAHSFVRGNWSRTTEATPMIVQKTCHDFDILSWNLDSPVAKLSSFGSLLHFRPENAPEGATARCGDGCPVADCPFDGRRVYLDPAVTGWPVEAIASDLSMEGRRRALAEGPYGVCVYRAGSDVVDHQTVSMQLENGATSTLIVQGHSDVEERTMRYDGTRATLRAKTSGGGRIEVASHDGAASAVVDMAREVGGHGGGDSGLMDAFITSVSGRVPGATDAAGAFESHLLAFLAEEARISGEVIDVTARRAGVS